MLLGEASGSCCGCCAASSAAEPGLAEAGAAWHVGKLLLSLVARVCAEHPSGGCLGEPSYAAKGSKLEDFSPFALLPLPAGGLRAAARGLAVVATDPYLPPTPALG